MIKKIIQYISYDIWFKKEHEYRSSKVRWAVRQFKVFLFTAQGFAEHSILAVSYTHLWPSRCVNTGPS